jgi:serine/threonine protein kinase/Tfp pilus assembly protein PilF
MRPERWAQVERLYHAALEVGPEARTAFLGEACAGDEELRSEVAALLVCDDKAAGFMEASAIELAAKALASDKQVGERANGSAIRGSSMTLTAGMRLGPYEVLTLLGAGGMGEVYRARDTRLGRDVALKVIAPRLVGDPSLRSRFEREARAASVLNHPSIVTVYDVGDSAGVSWIAMEWVEGRTLRQAISDGPLPLGDALSIARQIVDGLAAAHAKRIVHRDLKPENVMLTADGRSKILDFGLARLTLGEPLEGPVSQVETLAAPPSNATREGMILGTVGYMSPEQARGLPVDARSDIWSLGVILYEMVAGRLPFAGATPTDVLAAILVKEPEPLKKLRPGIPLELERIINRALAKNRDDRYPQAADLAVDLQNLRTLSEERRSRFALSGVDGSSIRLIPRPAVMALLALSLAAVALIVGGVARSRLHTGAAAIDSLAVLPLVNVGGSAETEYLSDGLTESLINRLSEISSLRVMAPSTVFRYKGREADPQRVGRELGVKGVVIGRVDRRGDTLVVQASLVNAADGSQVWGDRFDRRPSDALALQQEISREIADTLRLKLTGEEQRKLVKRYTDSPNAYQFYLRGRYFVEKRTRADLGRAIEYFQKAIVEDPKYARAYAGLAEVHYILPMVCDVPPKESFPQAKEAAAQALKIDDSLADAHVSMAMIHFWYDWDWKNAELEFSRAIALNPNDSTAHRSYGHLLSNLSRYPEAVEEMRRALDLDPFSLVSNALLGQCYYHARRYNLAIDQLRKTIELNPNFWLPHHALGRVYEREGMYEEALAEFWKARDLGGPTITSALAAYTYARMGRRREALKVLDELKNPSITPYVPPSSIAMVHLGLGEKEKAWEWLERAYEDRDPILTFIVVEPKWDDLRSDPRYADLVRRVGLTP